MGPQSAVLDRFWPERPQNGPLECRSKPFWLPRPEMAQNESLECRFGSKPPVASRSIRVVSHYEWTTHNIWQLGRRYYEWVVGLASRLV